MKNDSVRDLKPFLSVVVVIFSLLFLVFLRMEERRLGYSLLKLNAEYKKVTDQRRILEIQVAKVTRPQLVDSWAQKQLTLKKVNSKQIIHLSREGAAFSSSSEVTDSRRTL